MNKRIKIILLAIILCGICMACGKEEPEDVFKEVPKKYLEEDSSFENKNICNLPANTIYEILDVRESTYAYMDETLFINETICYIISMVLKDEFGERLYLNYVSFEEKDNQYIMFAKAVVGDSLEFNSFENKYCIYYKD